MNSRDFEKKLAKASGWPEREVDERIRPLRPATVLPIGGRGINAPNIDFWHAARMVMQMVPRRAVEAGEVGERAAELRPVPVPGTAAFPVPGNTLVDALAWLFANPAFAWHRLEVRADGRAAWITIDREGAPFDLYYSTDPERVAAGIGGSLTAYQNQGGGFCGHRFVIGAGAVQTLAYGLAAPIPSGWVERPVIDA